MLLGRNYSRVQVFLHRLENRLAMFGMHFALSKCRISLHKWVDAKPYFVLVGELRKLDKLCYLGDRSDVTHDVPGSRVQPVIVAELS